LLDGFGRDSYHSNY
jgi:drug/metabolite transporter (DMT)-like permease